MRARTGRRRLLPVLVAALGLALAAGACMPQAADVQGRSTWNLYQVFFWAGAFVALLVWALTTFAWIRYRRRGDTIPSQVRDNRALEIVWTAVPFLTVGVLFVLTLGVLGTVDAISKDPGVTVHVTGFRWSWEFAYEGQGVTVIGQQGQRPEMVVPVGTTVHVILTSADVNHAFYVPAFLFKRDAIPGRTNQFDFTVAQPGTYTGQCAEFCGLYHDQMLFAIRAVSTGEYQAWLASQRSASSASPASPAPSASAPAASAGTVGVAGGTQPSAAPAASPSASGSAP